MTAYLLTFDAGSSLMGLECAARELHNVPGIRELETQVERNNQIINLTTNPLIGFSHEWLCDTFNRNVIKCSQKNHYQGS